MDAQKQTSWKPSQRVIKITAFDVENVLIMSGLDLSERSRCFIDIHLDWCMIESDMIIESMINETYI